MRSGAMTENIAVERETITVSDSGADVRVWEGVIFTKAEVKYNSGSREIENTEIFYSNKTTFKVRFYHDIRYTDRIVYNNSKYRILSINPNRKDNSLTIETELINE